MKRRPDILNSLSMAFGFMTVLPIPQRKEWSDIDFGWAAVFYPLIGAMIGLIAGFGMRFFSSVFAKPIAALLTLILWLMLSGGLHWDGLADCMDGFGCAALPEKRLEVMKDPRLGTYGALGIFCALILKWLCLWHLPDSGSLIFFALSGAAARWSMLFLILLPLANPNGLAAMLRKNCPKPVVLLAAPIPVVLAILNGHTGLLYLLISLATAGLLGLTARKKIGGINGDVLGACIELGEIAILLAGQVIG